MTSERSEQPQEGPAESLRKFWQEKINMSNGLSWQAATYLLDYYLASLGKAALADEMASLLKPIHLAEFGESKNCKICQILLAYDRLHAGKEKP